MPLNLGIIADTNAQLDDLTRLIEKSGHCVAVSIRRSSYSESILPKVDAWVVRLNFQDESTTALIELLDNQTVPVVFDDVEVYDALGGDEKLSRFRQKLYECTSVEANATKSKPRAEEVWVLAASTGGPEAVAEFCAQLPDELAGVALLYVQHIGSEISGTLQRVIQNTTSWEVFSGDTTQVLREQGIYLVSPDHEIVIDESGTLRSLKSPWSGPYSPSIDQVIAKVARIYGKNCGAIIFTGMGDDGAKSCTFMKNTGGKVWAQSPESCTVDSMPSEAISTQVVSYISDPLGLAKHFVDTQMSRNIMRDKL